jgi:hypothetical protein
MNLTDREIREFERELDREDNARLREVRKADPELADMILRTFVQDSLHEGQSYIPGSGFVEMEVHTGIGQSETRVKLVNDNGRVHELIRELCEMFDKDPKRGSPHQRAYIGPDSLGRTREIGEELNALGGFKLMQTVHEEVVHLRRSAARTLEMGWDGIGVWQGY